jgi:hypothetical protein
VRAWIVRRLFGLRLNASNAVRPAESEALRGAAFPHIERAGLVRTLLWCTMPTEVAGPGLSSTSTV